MTFNIGWDSIFPDEDPLNHDLRQADRRQAFARIMAAVQPDIACLQEINERRSSSDLSVFLTGILGGTTGDHWQAVHVRDTLLASRFPLIERGYELETRTILPHLDQAAALVDLPAAQFGDADVYAICAHFKAGGTLGDILLRVRQADAIMAHLRDFSANGTGSSILAGTPLVLLGDFNIYDTDPARQLRTLLNGDISDQERYGADWSPDWDATPLRDAQPTHNAQGAEDYTWREDASPFNPRALDRIIYSDSVLKLEHAFVLDTELLTDGALERLGLQREDVLLDPDLGIHDHFPVIADFSLTIPE
jgi:endonuclease/exonuclease/phosphatase family metal-dependent hydrolase